MNHWENSIYQLEGYLKSNPDIILELGHIKLPSGKKQLFYNYLELTSEAFIQVFLQKELDECIKLSKEYQNIKKKTPDKNSSSRLNITRILKVPVFNFSLKNGTFFNKRQPLPSVMIDETLNSFLDNPLYFLSKKILGDVLLIVQNREQHDMSINKIKRDLTKIISASYTQGHLLWTLLLLLNHSISSNYYKIEDPGITLKQICKHTMMGIPLMKKVPQPEITNVINLRVRTGELRPSLLHPEIIFETKAGNSNRFIGIKNGLDKAHLFCSNSGIQRDFLPLNLVEQINFSDLLLIYISESINDVLITCDNQRIWKPDVIITSLNNISSNASDSISKIVKLNNILKPCFGTHVLSDFSPSRKKLYFHDYNISSDIKFLNGIFDKNGIKNLFNKILD